MTLLNFDEIDSNFGDTSWQIRASQDITDRLSNEEFPCLFAQNAFRRSLVKYSFIDQLNADGLSQVERDLTDYLARADQWNGKVSSAEPLLMLFSTEQVTATSIEDWHKIGWSILQHLHNNDPMPWPENTSLSPHSPFWSMAYCGTEIFVNMSCPSHVGRKSRNLGAGLVLVVNPRARFDIVAGNTPEGRRMRQKIRTRVTAYDGQDHCPQLGSYAAGEIEWWQYGIVDDNKTRTDQCPFKHREIDDNRTEKTKSDETSDAGVHGHLETINT